VWFSKVCVCVCWTKFIIPPPPFLFQRGGSEIKTNSRISRYPSSFFFRSLPFSSAPNFLSLDQWSDPFDLTRPNLWPGIVALILSVLTAVTALPFIRRQYFEWFYFNHIQVSFPINIFTMFHAREHYFFLLVIVVWIFQIDVMRRLFKKMESSKILSAKMVSRNILRMELARSRRGHLSLGDGSHQNRPGAYLWLSANKLIQSEAASGGGLPPLCIPPADKLKLPSWLHFHPLTIASAPGDKSWVVYIKDEGNYGQWSNALADRARASPRGVDSKPIADMKVRIGGPHGGMRMKPQDYEIVVLCAGGVGATLATAILSDYKTMKSGYARDTGVTTKIVMLWACRSLATFAAFKEELDRAMATRPLNVEYDLRAFLTRDPPADVQAVSVSEDHQNTDGNAYVAPVTTMMTRAEGGGGGGDSAAAAGGAACPELPLDALKAVFDKCAFANKKAKTLYMGREFYEKAVKALPAGSPEAASFASFFGGRAEADKGKGLHISWEDFLMLDVGRKEDYAWIRKEANARLPACLKMQPEVGRPDFRALLAQIKAENAGAKFGAVYACGPNALMLSAAQAAMTVNKDSKPGPVFHHHTEDWEV
jgi:ferredoxin-NADP reductase